MEIAEQSTQMSRLTTTKLFQLPTTVAAAASVRAVVEVERSNATAADADEITTSTTMTRTLEERDEEDGEEIDASGGQEEPTSGVEYLDISMDDDAGESTATNAFFFVFDLSQRGRQTDV